MSPTDRSSAKTYASSTSGPRAFRAQRVRGGAMVMLGFAAVALPLTTAGAMANLAGLAAIVSGALEGIGVFQRRHSRASRASAYVGAATTVGAGVLLLVSPILALSALAVLLAATFAFDGMAKIGAALSMRRAATRSDRPATVVPTLWDRVSELLLGSANLLLALLLITRMKAWGPLAISVFVGARILATGWALLFGRTVDETDAGFLPPSPTDPSEHPDPAMRLRGDDVRAMRRRADDVAASALLHDRAWVVTIVLTLLAIHATRTHASYSALSLIGPLVAVFGDAVVATLIGLLLVLPVRLGWRIATRPVERRAWASFRGRPPGSTLREKILRFALQRRVTTAAELARIGGSIRFALWRGLLLGLPATLLLVATNPIWGFSWYFNSENWAAEVWHRWAQRRTDAWREAMTGAALRLTNDPLPFAVRPAGTEGDFTFLVVGDPGEGDASQLVLSNQYTALSSRPDVKFLVVSSDVVYPDGAMRDYERCFYLPFRGFAQPIFAIPGNHDWYDANEGFNANILDPASATAALRARVEHDLRLTSTTDGRIASLVSEAASLRKAYGIRAGQQRAPYFELQTDRFALIAVDTGVARTLDPAQREWLEAALGRARGKSKMVLLGHPFYAGGADAIGDDEDFAALRDLFRQHTVDVVMAGDTHYFEYYRESAGATRGESDAGSRTTDLARASPAPTTTQAAPHVTHHFVNGGGGAYLSIGSGLHRPTPAPLPDLAFYPRTDALVARLDAQTPAWKWPVWVWTKRFGGWPFSTEAMSGAFDFNGEPSFQSFCEVRIEPSHNRVRVIPRGVRGPLKWKDLDVTGGVVPAGQTPEDAAEFVIDMPR